jgi:meiotic recombination protein DMC1
MLQEHEDTISSDQIFNDIDLLQNHGINASDINKLKSAGLCTCLGVIMTTRKEMLNIKGISDAKVDKIFEAAAKLE